MAHIVISGYMIRMPLVGNVLAFAQYLLGFERLGHSVTYVEESGWPQACYDPQSLCYSDDPCPGITAVRALLTAIGSSSELVYVDTANKRTFGMEQLKINECILKADLVLNLGGVCWLPAFEDAACLALIDMDPMFTQAGKFARDRLDAYDFHFTYGTNVGQSDCTVPLHDHAWRPIVPPVVPELWRKYESTPVRRPLRFTTIANWTAYGEIEWQGERYGQKDRQFLELIELPSATDAVLELAVSGMPSSVAERFRAAGWRLVDAAAVSRCLDSYHAFIGASAGELSVAKHGYVRSRTGWISDRTICYLATGRPVIVQDTGVPSALVQSDAWHTFRDMHDAIQAINSVSQNYSRAVDSARKLAEQEFSYTRVLPRLLELA